MVGAHKMDSDTFIVRKSNVVNGGLGLFTTRFIEKGTIIKCPHTKVTRTDEPAGEFEVLDFYVPKCICMRNACVWDGEVRYVADVMPFIKKSAFRKKFAQVSKDQVTMKANDLAWRYGLSHHTYEALQYRNQMELVLGFSDANLDAVYAYFNCDVECDVEVGITYGWSYWQ